MQKAPSPREELITVIKRQGLPRFGAPRPVVTLDQYFVGNSDLGSIGCNLDQHPGVEQFYVVLKSIRARPGVQDVLVEIAEVEEGDPEMWPFSDRVYVLGDVSKEDVSLWVESLSPSAVEEGWASGPPPSVASSGACVFGIWWD